MNKLAGILLLLLYGVPLLAQVRGSTITNTTPAAAGKTYALVIGISDYKELPKLQFADADASAFASYLKLSLADTSGVTLITNTAANKVNVLSALVSIKKKATKGDKVYIYFAGHGDIETEISNGGVLLLYDSPKENYYLNANGFLHQEDLKNIVSQMSTAGAQVFLITDACHSGSLSGGEQGAGKSLLALKDAWSNETKIFSCQANELSLEGKQWGNGRGLFSFHLVEGLTGLADEEGDADGKVSLFEIQTYLQKYVRKQAAPNKQTPFAVGNLDNNIAEVKPPLLAKLKESKAGDYPLFASAAGRGDVFAFTADANYKSFQQAVNEKRLIEPDKNSAAYFYTQLAKTISDAAAKDFLQRELIAALLNRSSEIIAPLLQGEMSYTSSTTIAVAVKEAAKAIELLGDDHYLAANFKARKLFLEAVQLTLTDEKNTANINNAIKKLNESVKLEKYAYYAYYQLGYLYNLQSNSAKALENYTVYLSYLPKDPEALNNVGVAYYNKADFAKAVEYYGKSLAVKPTAKAYTNRGLANLKLGKETEATKDFEEAIKLDKTGIAKVYFMVGKSNYEAKKFDVALTNFTKALEANKNHAPSQYYTALVWLAKKDTVKGLLFLDKAIASDAAYAEAYYKRGEVLFAQGKYQAAINDFDKAMLNPKLWNGYLYIGKAYLQLKQYEKAIDALESALMADKNLGKVLYLVLANAYRDGLMKYERANGYYQKHIELNPTDATGYAEAGYNFTLMKNYTAAEQHLKKAAMLAPSDVTVAKYTEQLNAAKGR
ncbi:MAG: tetratricopeptide repeat protein [Chitinophagales bacterium]|nr:tetratricopeptide repeat protein [Chitinophagales bacterium]